MKTIKILLLLLVFALVSCEQFNRKGVYEITYVVFYPGNADTATVQLNSNTPWEVNCNRGDNYIHSHTGGYYLSTSAPIKIIHQIKIK